MSAWPIGIDDVLAARERHAITRNAGAYRRATGEES